MTDPAKEPSPYCPLLLVATGLAVGYSRIMPGTVGALWGLPLAWGIYHVPTISSLPAWSAQFALMVVLFIAGIPVCSAAARHLGKKDPSAVVYDEIVTMPIVFFLLPSTELSHPWVWIAGFLLHRLFDILKPPPCRQLELLPGGLGIMADDAAAAIYACGVLHLLVWVVGRMG